MANEPSKETPRLDGAGFRLLWEALGAPRNMLLAVSGGADSMALLALAAPLAREGVRLEAATVDHGLRPEAAAEAAFVSGVARSLAIQHRVLSWRGEKPEAGLQAAARAARYRLLALDAETRGLAAIVTAHTADDQAETVMMRLVRGSGPRGLAAMPRETAIAAGAGKPVRLLRPMLSASRVTLRYALRDLGLRHVDDPSNDDERFERVRVRRLLNDLDSRDALTKRALLDVAARARATSERLAAIEEDIFRSGGGKFNKDGSASVERGGLIASRDGPLLARLIHAVSGSTHEPDEDRAGEVLTAALAGRTGALGGALVSAENDRIVIRREPAATLGRPGKPAAAAVILDPGERELWENRFIVTNPFPTRVEARAVGPTVKGGAGDAGLGLATAPGLWRDGQLVAFAGDPGLEDGAFQALAEERFYRRVNRFP